MQKIQPPTVTVIIILWERKMGHGFYPNFIEEDAKIHGD